MASEGSKVGSLASLIPVRAGRDGKRGSVPFGDQLRWLHKAHVLCVCANQCNSDVLISFPPFPPLLARHSATPLFADRRPLFSHLFYYSTRYFELPIINSPIVFDGPAT